MNKHFVENLINSGAVLMFTVQHSIKNNPPEGLEGETPARSLLSMLCKL